MFRTSVTFRYGTGLIVTAGLLVALCASQPAAADIGAIAPSDDSGVASGAYTPEDSAALLNVLEAPGPSPAADKTFEQVPESAQANVTALRNGPPSISGLALEPESKKFDAWDLKGGTIIPEPATALLMGAGLAALAVLRGRRGKSGTA